MKNKDKESFVYFFPGCTLTSTAKENYYSLKTVCKSLGFELIELEGWNCCGTTSAHSINLDLAIDLALRNLALAAEIDRLLVACPTCFLRLKFAHELGKTDVKLRNRFEQIFNVSFPTELKIISILEFIKNNTYSLKKKKSLNGLKFAPYYGCMLNIPPFLKTKIHLSKVMEDLLTYLGGTSVFWGYKTVCCGTFLSVVRPDAVSKVINKIFESAISMGAECIVTACSMCHLNLEIRGSIKNKLPVFHFSELIALSIGEEAHLNWFKRHIINPLPLLKEKKILES